MGLGVQDVSYTRQHTPEERRGVEVREGVDPRRRGTLETWWVEDPGSGRTVTGSGKTLDLGRVSGRVEDGHVRGEVSWGWCVRDLGESDTKGGSR